MRRKWLVLVSLGFLLLFSLCFEVPSSSAATVSKFIIINKATNRLAYYENGLLKKEFKVGTGRRPSYTPEGKFKIVNKIVNRPYYTGHIRGGDPRNPLGNRWLGLNARGTWGTTYAIHGNNNPSSIGGYVSGGCIRMFDNEVEWLFSQVPVNTPVVITTSKSSFDAIAVANGLKSGQGTPSVPVSTSSEILKRGSRGPSVVTLQKKLTALGFNTKGIDGIFGPNTDNAVRKFETSRHLPADGIVGATEKKALGIN